MQTRTPVRVCVHATSSADARMAHAGFIRRASGGGTRWGYQAGRHKFCGAHEALWARGAFVAKVMYTPWPEVVQRITQIAKRVPEADVKAGSGWNHLRKAKAAQVNLSRIAVLRGRRQTGQSSVHPSLGWSDLRVVGATQQEPMASLHQGFLEIFGDIAPGFDNPNFPSFWEPERPQLLFSDARFRRGAMNETLGLSWVLGGRGGHAKAPTEDEQEAAAAAAAAHGAGGGAGSSAPSTSMLGRSHDIDPSTGYVAAVVQLTDQNLNDSTTKPGCFGMSNEFLPY